MLIQGHTVLTEMFTIEALPGLEAALTQLRDEVLDGIRRGLSLADILDRGYLPEVLRDHPKAVLPYLVTRDNFTAQLYHQRSGYWGADRRGLEPVTAQQLMERYQQDDAFRFLIYAELAEAEIGPVR